MSRQQDFLNICNQQRLFGSPPGFTISASFNFIDIFSHTALTDNGKDHYCEIKHVPSQFKVVKAHGYKSNDGFYDENPGEDVV